MLEHTPHTTPFQRLLIMLNADRRDLVVLVVYTILSGLLTLTVPLTAQALVNTIAAGVLLQPLVVLSSLLFVGLLFAGTVRAFQFYLVEIIQQRVFVRVAIHFAHLLPLVEQNVLLNEYPPELVNRFFDVVNLQKSLAKILLDGPAAILQIIVGLAVMALYSPLLMGFDVIFVVVLILIVFALGKEGVISSIEESKEKYAVASWLEDVARCQTSFKLDASLGFAIKRADTHVKQYLVARQSHFTVLFRQVIGHYFFYAVANAGILGIGGWLVIHRQLTLGQLIASELIIILVLAAMDKLVALLPDWFDLLTSLEKVGHLIDLPVERLEGVVLSESTHGIALTCKQVDFEYKPGQPVLSGLSFEVKSGERVSMAGCSSSGKSTLVSLLSGLLQPTSGSIELDAIDTRSLDIRSLRSFVGVVTDDNGIFQGTLEDNITLGRPTVSPEQIKWALTLTQLADEVYVLPNGIKIPLVSAGRNLSQSQIQRIMIARAIVDKPRLLILDEAYRGIDNGMRHAIVEALYAEENPWTIFCTSQDIDVILKATHVHVMDKGTLVESGHPSDLLSDADSQLAQLYPMMAHTHSHEVSDETPEEQEVS